MHGKKCHTKYYGGGYFDPNHCFSFITKFPTVGNAFLAVGNECGGRVIPDRQEYILVGCPFEAINKDIPVASFDFPPLHTFKTQHLSSERVQRLWKECGSMKKLKIEK